MKKGLATFGAIFVFALFPTLLIWIPFFFKLEALWGIPLPRDGMATIVANFDGPLYLVVAKSLYDKQTILSMVSFPLPAEYYAAHFPLFPLLIKLFAGIFGFPYSMLFVTATTSLLAIYFFNKLARLYFNQRQSLWLTFVFALFPARWLIVRSVGSPEPLFLSAVMASVYYFRKKNYLLAGAFGALAQITKSPGILLFVAYLASIAIPYLKKVALGKATAATKMANLIKYAPILLIPVSLLGVFVFYQIKLNDFLAYFHSGDNIHLFFPPFSIFNYASAWVGTYWLEEVIFVYLFGALGLINLYKQKKKVMFWFTAIFFASLLFVAHRDIIRYFLPAVPFLLLSFGESIVKKEFKIAFMVILIPIYLFSLAYISQNTMPVSDWAPLL